MKGWIWESLVSKHLIFLKTLEDKINHRPHHWELYIEVDQSFLMKPSVWSHQTQPYQDWSKKSDASGWRWRLHLLPFSKLISSFKSSLSTALSSPLPEPLRNQRLISDFEMSSLIATVLLFLLLNTCIGEVEPKTEECCKEKKVGSVFYSLLPDHHSYSREFPYFSFFSLFFLYTLLPDYHHSYSRELPYFFFFFFFLPLFLHLAARRPLNWFFYQGASLFFIFICFFLLLLHFSARRPSTWLVHQGASQFFILIAFFFLLLHFAARQPSTSVLHQGASLFFIFLSTLCCPTMTIKLTLTSGSCRSNVSTAASTQSPAHQALSFAFRQVSLYSNLSYGQCTWQSHNWAFYLSSDVLFCIIIVHSISRGSSNRVPIWYSRY